MPTSAVEPLQDSSPDTAIPLVTVIPTNRNPKTKSKSMTDAKKQGRRNSVIESMRRSSIGALKYIGKKFTGGDDSKRTDDSIRKRLKEKEKERQKEEEEKDVDFTNFKDLDARRQLEIESQEGYFMLSDIVSEQQKTKKLTSSHKKELAKQNKILKKQEVEISNLRQMQEINDELTDAMANYFVSGGDNGSQTVEGETQKEIRNIIERSQVRRRSLMEVPDDDNEDAKSVADEAEHPSTPGSVDKPHPSPFAVEALRNSFNAMPSKGIRLFGHNVSLTYTDFVPKFVSNSNVEPLDSILVRVNQWLSQENVDFISIETVVVPIDCIVTTQLDSDKQKRKSKTATYAECIRVWYNQNSKFLPRNAIGRQMDVTIQLTGSLREKSLNR